MKQQKSEALMLARLFGALFALVFVGASITFIFKAVFVSPEQAQAATPALPQATSTPTLTLESLQPDPPSAAQYEYTFQQELTQSQPSQLQMRSFNSEYDTRVRERLEEVRRQNGGKTNANTNAKAKPNAAVEPQSALTDDEVLWGVQLSLGKNEDNANAQRDALMEQGYPAEVFEQDTKNGKRFALILVGYSKAEALEVKKKFKGSQANTLEKLGIE